MTRRMRVGVLFGGKSAEHEVSLLSAKYVAAALDRQGYDVVLIGIDENGHWRKREGSQSMLESAEMKLLKVEDSGAPGLALRPGERTGLIETSASQQDQQLDVVFPVLHGPHGEDGSVQGLLKLGGIPFVGSDVLGSAVGMDKDVSKRLLRDAGLPIAGFQTITSSQRHHVTFDGLVAKFGPAFFVKPANMGSSVGVSKIDTASDFRAAMDLAFSYDMKVLVEENVEGRELEVAVLGGDQPTASVPGEIVTKHGFYDYEAKYIDENGAELIIPAPIDDIVTQKVRETAVRVFEVLCLHGMARVDFFLRGDDLIINEANTIPGFTSISMYPKLWEHSGMLGEELVKRLVDLALERHQQQQQLRTKYASDIKSLSREAG